MNLPQKKIPVFFYSDLLGRCVIQVQSSKAMFSLGELHNIGSMYMSVRIHEYIHTTQIVG